MVGIIWKVEESYTYLRLKKIRKVQENIQEKAKSRRTWRPNLLKVRAQFGGTTRTITICTRCLKAGFVDKKVNVPKAAEVVAEN